MSLEGVVHARCPCCLNAVDFHIRFQRLHSERNPGNQTATTNRNDYCLDIFKLIENLKPYRSLTRNNVVVIVRVNESCACLLNKLYCPVVSVIIRAFYEFDVCAETTRAFDLHDGSRVGHTYCRRNSFT